MGSLENMEKKSIEINIPSAEEIKKLIKFPGKVRGVVLKWHMKYVLEKKGEEGLRKLEKEIERLGYHIEYKKIKESGWYPVYLVMVSLSTIVAIFNWGRKELIEMAQEAPKVSFVIRFFMKYFVSPEKVVKIAPRLWPRYFNIGSVEAIDFKDTQKDGYVIMRLKKFKLHPFYCFYLGYFFIGMAKLIRLFKTITVEETKCMFRGDNYHEYLIKWTH